MTSINKNIMASDPATGLPVPTQLTDWKGQNNKLTAVWPDSTIATTQINLRMRVNGELQRRNGMASSNVAVQAGAVLGIIPVINPSSPTGNGIIVLPTGGSVQAYGSPKTQWLDAFPLIPTGTACNLFATLTDVGTTSKNSELNPPSDSCAGTITIQGYEASGRSSTGNYGYSFAIECFGPGGLLATYNSACLVNQIASYAMPATTITVTYDVTGGCAGGMTPGTWGIAVSTP